MKIHLVTGSPPQSAPPQVEAHAMLATAHMGAASMVNAMRIDHGLPATASADTWPQGLEELNARLPNVQSAASVQIGETELKGLAMRDWRISGGQHDGITFLPWPMQIEANLPEALRICIWHPDDIMKTPGQEREIRIEIIDTAVVVHCCDSQHEEPVNIYIERDGISIDSDRMTGKVTVD